MDEKTMLILKGQSILMEMLLSMMPNYIAEQFIDDVNAQNQEVIMAFSKEGLQFTPPRDPSKKDK